MKGQRRMLIGLAVAVAIVAAIAVRLFVLKPRLEYVVTGVFPSDQGASPVLVADGSRNGVSFAQSGLYAPEDGETAPKPEDPAPAQEEILLGQGMEIEVSDSLDFEPIAQADEGVDVPVTEVLIVGGRALAVGETLPLSAVVLPEEAAQADVAWASENERVATVDERGVVTAISPGEAQIFATALDGSGVGAALPVSVYVPEAESLVGVPSEMTIGVGQTLPMTWQVLPEHASQEVSLRTSNRNIAMVSESGKVRGVKSGSCMITVETPNGRFQVCWVTVLKAPAALALNAESVRLGVGSTDDPRDSFTLRPRIATDAATSFSFRSSREEVASVDGDGVITAVAPGEATVTVMTHNGLQARCTVNVGVAPQEIEVAGPLSLSVGDALQAQVWLLPEGAGSSLRFSSVNERVMAVSPEGVVTGLSVGSTMLRVESFNGKIALCPVNVYSAPEALTVLPETVTLGVGEKMRLNTAIEPASALSGLTYASSQRKNVSVDGEGEITGLHTGTATVTVSTYNGRTDSAKIEVRKAPEWIALNETNLTLGWDPEQKLGERFSLNAKLSGGSAGSYSFKSSNENVVVVDAQTGQMRACSRGTSIITVRTYNGREAHCNVRVEKAPMQLSSLAENVVLGVGEKYAFLEQQEGASRLVCTSADERVATVSEAGVILARGEGVTTVRAETFNGCAAEITVAVLPAPEKLSLAQASAVIGIGGQFQLVPVIAEGTAASFSYASSRNSIATVDENGLVTGVGKGTTTITVRTHNGKRSAFTVRVLPAPEKISLNRAELRMQPGEAQVLKATLPNGTAANISFSSSDETVAAVDGAGNIEALRLGQCVITATTHNGHEAQCRLYVEEGPASIRVPADMMIGTSELVRPDIEVFTTDGARYDGEYTLTSSNSSIVSVSGTSLRGRRSGSATVTVRSHTLTESFNVEVVRYGTLYPTLVFAHRGASAYVQNNTIEAFRLAYEMGADGVELDVRRTKDGELVIFHDPSLDVDGRRRRIVDMTLEELKAIDLNGCTVPTLDEALEYLKSTGMMVQVELKADGVGADSADAVRRWGMQDKVIFISFSLAELSEAKYEDASARLGYIFNVLSFDIERLARQYDLYALLPRYAIVNEKLVNMIHSAGLRVGTWTINDAENVAQLSQMGVDYINTDRPDMARSNIN